MKRKYLALALAGIMTLSMTACGGKDTSATEPANDDAAVADDTADTSSDAEAPAASGDAVTIQIGFENSISEPHWTGAGEVAAACGGERRRQLENRAVSGQPVGQQK